MTLAVRLEPALEKRLAALATQTHRTKTFYVSKALETYIEDMEDVYIALERLENPGRRWSMEEVDREIDLARGVGRQSSKSTKKARSPRTGRNKKLP